MRKVLELDWKVTWKRVKQELKRDLFLMQNI